MQDMPATYLQPHQTTQLAVAQASVDAGLWLDLVSIGTIQCVRKLLKQSLANLQGDAAEVCAQKSCLHQGQGRLCCNSFSSTAQQLLGTAAAAVGACSYSSPWQVNKEQVTSPL